MKTCVMKDPPDIIRYQFLNDLFHLTTINIIGHERLKKIILSLNNQIHRYSYKSLSDKKHLKTSYKYHKKIFQAIIRKEIELAERLTREHVVKGLEVLLRSADKNLKA